MKSGLRASLYLALLLLAVVVAIIAASGAGARLLITPPKAQWGPDIRANTLADPDEDKHINFSIAINPVSSTRALASYDFEGPSGSGSGYSWSTDFGRTWSGGPLTGTWGGALGMAPAGNTSVAFDARGTAFLASQAFSPTMNGYFVLTATDSATWGTPVPVVVSDNSTERTQARLAVDGRTSGSNAGSAYMVWRQLGASGSPEIWSSFSRDVGRTWSSQVKISDNGHEFSSGPMVAVASNGTVYASFLQLDEDFISNTFYLYFDRSTDGGVTWGADHLLSGAPIQPVGAPDDKGRELVLIGNATDAPLHVDHFPSIAVSQADQNTVYAVWNDGRWDSTYHYLGDEGKHADIAFSRSTNGGDTWSAPLRVNDDMMANGIDQFMPTIAVGKDIGGSDVIGVTWYDRRNSPDAYLYDLFYSESHDGGLTWSTNRRVSNYTSDPLIAPDGKGVGDLGYYSGLAYGLTSNGAYSDYVLPAWVDSRRTDAQDFYTDRGLICSRSFTDVQPTDYFYDAVTYLTCTTPGVISGYDDGTFRPFNNTTRGQIAKIVVLAESWSIYSPPTPTFRDVPANHTFYQYIETAYHQGIISGYTCGLGCLEFRPANNVTRAQITKIVVLAEGWSTYTPPTPTFRDVPTSDAFYQFVETAYHNGVISGYNCGSGCLEFRPSNPAVRGQVSKIVYNAICAP